MRVAALNPPRVLPGLGRSIVNFLIENRSTWDDDGLVEAFKPAGVNEDGDAAAGVKNTVSAFRAIGILENGTGGTTTLGSSIATYGRPFDRVAFRRLMVRHVFDVDRDGDPWSVAEGEASTSGARDLSRGLSWLLAQDALGEPLHWRTNVQRLQAEHFATTENDQWALSNDTRWGALSRWAPALGLAVPSVVRTKPGLVPLPTLAISDALHDFPAERMTIFEFLEKLAQHLPVLPGGILRSGLVARLGTDPDPGISSHAVDSSIGQVVRLLEAQGRLVLDRLADADGVQLSSSDPARTTHVTLKGGRKK
ncbi:protein DpdG [Geodermatophilus sp. SYSU D01036]